MNVCDYVTNTFLFADATKAQLDALNPSLMSNMTGGSTIAGFVIGDFVFGILLVLLYALIRPRFGAGGGTAIRAALFMWAVSSLTWAYTTIMGLFTLHFFLMSSAVALVTILAAGYVGAMLYKED